MNKFIKKTIFIFAGVLLSGFFSQTVFAANYLDVEQPVGTNLNGDSLFKADNIYPGWSKTVTLRVRNKSQEDSADIYFNFDAKGDKRLADKLKVYVVRIKDNSYRVGGTGDHWTLKEADEKNLYIGRLKPGEATQYKVKIKFDKDAGNEYQGLKAKFSVGFRMESQVAQAGQTERQILANQGRGNFTGNQPAEEGGQQNNNTENNQNENGNVAGANKENGGKTLGEETGCHSWPRWIWVLATLIFLGLSLLSTQKTKKEKIKQHFSWQLGGVIGAIALWYFFDKCQYYKWFPLAVVVIGILNHLYYQKIKGVKKNLGD